MSAADDFLMGGGEPCISWRNKPTGTTVTGTVCRESKVVQQRDPEDNRPLFWDEPHNTQPKMQLVVYIQTDQRDPSVADDDGVRRLFIKGKSLTDGLRAAVRESGRKGLEVGGVITVTFVGEGEAKNKIYNPPKLYKVTYKPPAAGPDSSAQFLGAGGRVTVPTSTPFTAPAGLDQAAWANLDDAQRSSLLSAMASAGTGSGAEPPF